MTLAAPLPRGTVAFLFTDIEGSTQLLETYGDAYAAALMRHRELLIAACTDHGGVVVRPEGDALFVAFQKASDAIGAAVAGQRAVTAEPWPGDMVLRVRMGLHAGEVDVVHDDYVGMSVHVAARVSSAAHGGQVLVTEETSRLAGDLETLDLGLHRLKDVGEFRLLQLLGPGLLESFPPPRTATVLPNNLPAQVDSFIGRQQELADVKKAVGTDRLVTLTGAGGSGKTRLALEAAEALLPDFVDGVWLIPLASLTDERRLVEFVAQTLRVSDQPTEAIADSLERWLRERRLLLVLDNCEHVIHAAVEFCDRYLQACRGLRIVATSREILGLRGERALSTPPLSVPEDDGLVADCDAVNLFVERAEAVAGPGCFDLAQLPLVAQVCRRLDGLPLAIELAAARTRSMSIDQIATRLGDRFRLLTGKADGHLSRSRTLEAVVAWSFELLSETEKKAFGRLSIFPDHFSLEMAEAVIADDATEEADVLDLVSRLVDKSLVSTVLGPDGRRFRLLETLREYGTGRLMSDDAVDDARRKLFAWAVRDTKELSRVMRTPAMDDALRQATINAATFRAVMDWALEHGEPAAALRIASLVPITTHRGERRDEILRCLGAAERNGEVDDLSVGEAWAAIGNIAFEQDDPTASRTANRRAIEHFLAAGRSRLAAWTQYLDVHAAWAAGELDEVDRLVEEAIRHFRSERDQMGLGYCLWVASQRTGDLGAGAALAAEADQLLREAGVPLGVAHNVEGRGIIAYEQGRFAEAAGFVAEAVTTFASYENLGCTAHAVEAAAVIIGVKPSGRPVALELLASAEELRVQSGQGHRPWEIRSRLGSIESRIATSAEEVALTRQEGPLLGLSEIADLTIRSLLGDAI